MRDGIYTDSPVPILWQRIRLACRNDADWREAGPLRALRALLSDIRASLDPSALRRLRERVRCRQPQLFDTVHLFWSEVAGDPTRTNLELRMLEHIDRRASGHCPTEEHLTAGLADALLEYCSGRERDIRTDIALRSDGDGRQVAQRVAQVLSEVSVTEIAEELLRGRCPPSPRLRGDGVSLDGDDLCAGEP